MEISNATYSFLTNYEVMQILLKVKGTKKKFGMRNLATVTYEALEYLEETPCKTQTADVVKAYLSDLSKYKQLKPKEMQQMVNDPPTSALHTQLLIDDNKTPLTEQENNAIIELSRKHFRLRKTKVVEQQAAK